MKTFVRDLQTPELFREPSLQILYVFDILNKLVDSTAIYRFIAALDNEGGSKPVNSFVRTLQSLKGIHRITISDYVLMLNFN